MASSEAVLTGRNVNETYIEETSIASFCFNHTKIDNTLFAFLEHHLAYLTWCDVPAIQNMRQITIMRRNSKLGVTHMYVNGYTTKQQINHSVSHQAARAVASCQFYPRAALASHFAEPVTDNWSSNPSIGREQTCAEARRDRISGGRAEQRQQQRTETAAQHTLCLRCQLFPLKGPEELRFMW